MNAKCRESTVRGRLRKAGAAISRLIDGGGARRSGTASHADVYGSWMCGRLAIRHTWKQIHDVIGLSSQPRSIEARYNIAPAMDAAVVRPARGARRLDLLRWGLIPSWSRDSRIGYRAISARAETVATSPLFQAAFLARRCVIPVSGFYEWRVSQPSGHRQPHYIAAADGSPLLLAGLWESWKGPEGTVESFAIVTTMPNTVIGRIHSRMPAILSVPEAVEWMESKTNERLERLLAPCGSARLVVHSVSARVNTPRVDRASLIVPAGAPQVG